LFVEVAQRYCLLMQMRYVSVFLLESRVLALQDSQFALHMLQRYFLSTP
jgi:hypothetical protein